MLSNDLDRIGAGHAQYTLLLDERGCPIDDLIAYRFADDHLLLVVNASRVDDDRDLAGAAPAGEDVTLDDRTVADGDAGPAGTDRARTWSSCRSWCRSASPRREVCGVHALVARTGYTGEPGVELMCAMERAGGAVGRDCVAAGAVPCGLGARDTLRLEICYPLYGNDLSEQRTALESGLGWACALDAKDFMGAEALREQKRGGRAGRSWWPSRMSERGIPRPGMPIAARAAWSPAAPCRRR